MWNCQISSVLYPGEHYCILSGIPQHPIMLLSVRGKKKKSNTMMCRCFLWVYFHLVWGWPGWFLNSNKTVTHSIPAFPIGQKYILFIIPARLKCPGRDFLGGPVAKTPNFQCRGPGFSLLSGNWIPHAARKSSRAATKDPTWGNKDWKSHMPQLRPSTVK